MEKFNRKKYAETTAEDVGSMKRTELRRFVGAGRKAAKNQLNIFNSDRNKNVWSPAAEKLEDYFDNNKKAISRMTMAQLRHEANVLTGFFKAKTSTVKGARELAADQDKAIFGVDPETGKPRHRMNYKTRTAFFAAYNEFININKEAAVRNWGSHRVMSFLGSLVIDARGKRKKLDINMSLFETLRQNLEDEKMREDWEESFFNGKNSVLSGKRGR